MKHLLKYEIFYVYLHVTINQSQRTGNMQMWYLIIKIFILKSQEYFK